MKKSLQMKFMLLLFALVVGCSSVWAEEKSVTWTISGVATTANNQQVNTALTTSSISPSGASGTWTAVSDGTSSYAGSSSGAQLGASSNREFNGTVTLSSTSIPSSATIKSVAVTITANGTSTLSATVNSNSLGDSKSITNSTTTYTVSGSSRVGNSIVLTFSSTQTSKYIKITSIVVTYEESSDPTINPTAVSALAYTATSGSISYTLTNIPVGAKVSASVPGGSWLTIDSENITTTSVPFTMAANTGGPKRSETVTLSYTGAENKTVVITQNADPSYLCGGSVTISVSDMGVTSNGTAFSSYTTPAVEGGYITLTGDKGTNSNAPKFYDNGKEIRFYAKNKLTVSTKNNTNLAITKVELTFASGENQNSISVDCGVYDNKKPGTWLGVNAPIEFTIGGDSGNRRISTITVYYALKLSGEQTYLNITSPYVIASGSTVTGTLTCLDADNLVIADGGQLNTTSENVKATVYKNIAAATAVSKTDATYWYVISANVEDPSISSNTNLITLSGVNPTYDLYRFNETKNAESAWENYRNDAYDDFDELTKGRGYLYRNASALTITMTGDINVEDFTYNVTKTGSGEYAGFNLIGNPYTHNIYKGTGTAITNGTSTLSTGFYYLEPSTGKWAKGTDQSTAIAPNQGILVQVNETGNINMTNTDDDGVAKSHNDYIMLGVANSQYSDEAYAWFDEGIGLNKIEHRNSEIPMLYINQDGENFAIATMSDETQSFNLNFKAATIGKYTLSYKAKGEYSYLHVIDRLTGEDVDMLLEGEYSFIGAPTDNDNRFIVKLSYNANGNATYNDIFAYQSGSDIIVNGNGELQIFDLTGRMVATQHVNGVETISVQSQGVYIFKLNEKVQKIVVR